nr:hypothetical protein [Hymenobacter nivis]
MALLQGKKRFARVEGVFAILQKSGSRFVVAAHMQQLAFGAEVQVRGHGPDFVAFGQHLAFALVDVDFVAQKRGVVVGADGGVRENLLFHGLAPVAGRRRGVQENAFVRLPGRGLGIGPAAAGEGNGPALGMGQGATQRKDDGKNVAHTRVS